MSRTRLGDEQAHQMAEQLLAAVAGGRESPVVAWDPEHHLQGHAEIDGEHVIVIAPRDDEHRPLVLTEVEWDELRRLSMSAA